MSWDCSLDVGRGRWCHEMLPPALVVCWSICYSREEEKVWFSVQFRASFFKPETEQADRSRQSVARQSNPLPPCHSSSQPQSFSSSSSYSSLDHHFRPLSVYFSPSWPYWNLKKNWNKTRDHVCVGVYFDSTNTTVGYLHRKAKWLHLQTSRSKFKVILWLQRKLSFVYFNNGENMMCLGSADKQRSRNTEVALTVSFDKFIARNPISAIGYFWTTMVM